MPHNDETKKEADSWWKCGLQTHRNHLQESGAHRSLDYTLSFVEFGEDGRLLESRQKIALRKHLESKKQNYVIVFVHGWRNDAQRGNTDVKRFRLLLSYASSVLSQRCARLRRYCDAHVTGVFVGWRGQMLRYDPDNIFGTVIAAPTLLSRKPASERVAHRVVPFLRMLDSELKKKSGKFGAFAQNKLLIVGHSLGGNMLATGLESIFLNAIEQHKIGAVMKPPIGDLVLLLNPAAEASKWTSLQREISRRRTKFPNYQKPIYVSLTSACHYPVPPRKPVSCDTATGRLFPLFKIFGFESDPEKKVAIGHLDGSPKKKVGTTHELEINGSLYLGTSYALATHPRYSECLPGDGWLMAARVRQKYRVKWDAGHLTKVAPTDKLFALDYLNTALHSAPEATLTKEQRNLKRVGELKIRAQFRHGIYIGQGPAITGANDPFWNVRAHDSAVIEHGGIVGPLTWCAIHQLVLDDVTAKRPNSRTSRMGS